MADHPTRAFSLGDLIDYEVQLALDSQARPEDLAQRDKNVRIDSAILKKGKAHGLKLWLRKVRGPYGEAFMQARALLNLGLIALGALLGWGTIRGLLTYNGLHPVNVLPFFAIFVLLPVTFLLFLLLRGFVARLFGRLPGGWVAASGHWLLTRVMKKNQRDLPLADVWHRLKSMHPRVFTWQAWILSQSFAFAYYLTALASLLFYVSVHDYAFAWQTTLRLGPDALFSLVHALALPFAWLGPLFVPTMDVIQTTQYDRFTASYVSGQGSAMAADWWPFLAALIGFYGLLPRLVLLLLFKSRLALHLRSLRFDDFASEEVWLRLQRSGISWQSAAGTKEMAAAALPEPMSMTSPQPLLIVRWRQAPFSEAELRNYFEERGHRVGSILDAEGRDSEFQNILQTLQDGQSLALVCDPWELPGEAFNRLRLAMREKLPVRTPIFLVPLLHDETKGAVETAIEDRPLWEASLKAFRDPYVGLLLEGSHAR
ncbi:MAG TPA: DUF2868 domain-containing protein [Oligoflexus sp.]|uniref:DUF2868 domain-containing protein n=1 Tax=Oligoflexus sp. TaxID=1971216 RepID=UPI002D7E6209|nr:DUF2868 domain-containing protein [Oligoflexus sp.]HET9238668.1 DUF2868 domain-containing protein [Oligoflexus sp.]